MAKRFARNDRVELDSESYEDYARGATGTVLATRDTEFNEQEIFVKWDRIYTESCWIAADDFIEALC